MTDAEKKELEELRDFSDKQHEINKKLASLTPFGYQEGLSRLRIASLALSGGAAAISSIALGPYAAVPISIAVNAASTATGRLYLKKKFGYY